jgi:hypothetical protein
LPAIYDVYGLPEPALGNEPSRLAEALGVAWEEHDSDHRGAYFIAPVSSFGGGRLVLQANDLRDGSRDAAARRAPPECSGCWVRRV